MKRITVTLTEDQLMRLLQVLADDYKETDGVFGRDYAEQNAFDKRILNKLARILVKS